MKFICLVYFEAQQLKNLTAEERIELDRASLAYDVKLKSAGHFLAAEALQSPKNARTVSQRNGQVIVTDGPWAENKEQLGGFILIDAINLEQAVALAAEIPLAKLGRIEVRPIYNVPVG